MPVPTHLLLIDDDLLSREVLTLLAEEAGFEVTACESGQQALQAVAAAPIAPQVVLSDMQMPGLSGHSLGLLLRAACGPRARLIAMSGSRPPAHQTAAFDAFLLKPFSMHDLTALLADSDPARSASSSRAPLDPAIFASLSHALKADQLRELYAMSLDDADRRIGQMRQAAAAGDTAAYHRSAHAIKGGCGMVGAAELAQLAGEMEENGPVSADTAGNTFGPLDRFLAASQELRRMLDAQLK